MLEMLIALATSSALAAALVQNLAETQRFSSAGQDSVMAFAIAQEIIDMTRNMPFGSLGSDTEARHYNLVVNRLNVGDPVGDPPFVHPLLIDVTNPNQTWSAPAKENYFDALAFVDITPKDIDGATGVCLSKRVKVTVQWPSAAPVHNYVMYTLVSQNGIHN
jgi:type II secretory pathway pseudopilin PulG